MSNCKMVKTRSNVVFDLLTLERRVRDVKKTSKNGLKDYEKKRLIQPIQPMNFQFADRAHAESYAVAIENKIRCINSFTDNGVDIFKSRIKFPLYFVYPMLVDFYHLIDDYKSVKDKYLYHKHREETDKYLCQPEPNLNVLIALFILWWMILRRKEKEDMKLRNG